MAPVGTVIDVILDPVDEATDLNSEICGLNPEGEVGVGGFFGAEVRVAALEGHRPLVYAVGVEVEARRGPKAAGHVQDQRGRLRHLVEDPGVSR